MSDVFLSTDHGVDVQAVQTAPVSNDGLLARVGMSANAQDELLDDGFGEFEEPSEIESRSLRFLCTLLNLVQICSAS
jgi:hypothetical protein